MLFRRVWSDIRPEYTTASLGRLLTRVGFGLALRFAFGPILNTSKHRELNQRPRHLYWVHVLAKENERWGAMFAPSLIFGEVNKQKQNIMGAMREEKRKTVI
jgi:hypothetical protein